MCTGVCAWYCSLPHPLEWDELHYQAHAADMDNEEDNDEKTVVIKFIEKIYISYCIGLQYDLVAHSNQSKLKRKMKAKLWLLWATRTALMHTGLSSINFIDT